MYMCACLCTRAHTVHMICFAGGAPRHNYFKQFFDPPAEVETLVMDQSLDVIEPVFKHTRRTGSAKPNETHVMFPSLPPTDFSSSALSIAVVAERGGLRYFRCLAQGFTI